MPFVRRYKEIMEKIGIVPIARLWFSTLIFSGVVYLVIAAYVSASMGFYSVQVVNRALALTAFTLIGCALALSGLCYFWNFLDTKIIYRRYLGLAGFAFGLTHAILSAVLYAYFPSSPNYEFSIVWDVFGLQISNVVAFAAGLAALVIFSIMAAISNQYAVHELGGKLWRQTLRYGGYSAYVLVILHYGIKEAHVWVRWLRTPITLMPPSFVMFLFGLAVIVLRFALWIDVRRKREQERMRSPRA